MDRFDAGFESTYCCNMHKLVTGHLYTIYYILNEPVEIKPLRNITQSFFNKENVFFSSSSSFGIDQMLPVTSSHWPL